MARKTYQDALHSHPDFSPLFSVLRTELGRDWTIYTEFLEDYRDASIAGENLTPWANQMEPLIQSPAARFAHHGVLFLLKEMYSRLSRPSNKKGTTSNAPLLAAEEPSLQKLGQDTEGPVLSPTQPLTADSGNESTLMAPPSSNASASPAPTSISSSHIPTAAPVSREHSHTNTPLHPTTVQDPIFFSDAHFKRAVQDFFSGSTPPNDTATSSPP